jgi:hypothetical protein
MYCYGYLIGSTLKGIVIILLDKFFDTMALVIYDDTGKKSEVIADIIGEKGFADVVVKKRRLEEPYGVLGRKRAVTAMFPDVETYLAFCKTVISGQDFRI